LEIVIATKNKGKIEEIKGYNKDFKKIKWLAYEDFKGIPEIKEVGGDSGLIVDALEGKPGIYSSRYAGPDATDEDNRVKLLEELKRIKDPLKRTARFICSMIYWDAEEGLIFKTEGVCEGRISFEEKGQGGFGYDPIFIPEGLDRTMAQLSRDEKNRISHRGKALADFFDFIVKL